MSHEPYKNRILVVDDNQSTLFLLKRILEKRYSLLMASSGEDALKILKEEEPPDLILLDIMMPGMSGYALYDELQKINRIASIPVIFVTALGSEGDEIKGLETGAVDYIIKPINQKVLIARIDNILALSRYQRDSWEKLPETLGELFLDESIEEPEPDYQPYRSSQPSLVMIVNPDNKTDLKDFIQKELADDFQVIEFHNEAEVYKYCKKEQQPDIILFDIDQSKEQRFAPIQKLKTDPRTQSVPVILLTALVNPDDEILAFEEGCSDYITKPIIPSILRARIRIHVELKKHREAFEQHLEAFMDE